MDLLKWVKGLAGGADYSLMNTTKSTLFLITSREEKYKGKAAAGPLFHRTGDAPAALVLFVGVNFLLFTVERFAMLNVAVTVVWIVLCVLLIREYGRRRAGAVKGVAPPGPLTRLPISDTMKCRQDRHDDSGAPACATRFHGPDAETPGGR